MPKKKEKVEPEVKEVSTASKHSGVPATEEQQSEFLKTWSDIEDSIKKVYKKK